MAEDVAYVAYPDIERAACTILSRAAIKHPILAAWVSEVCGNPTFATPLDEYGVDLCVDTWDDHARAYLATPAIAYWKGRGFAVPGGPKWTLHAALRERLAYPPDESTWGHWALSWLSADLDAAASALATKVVLFRRDGRPAGDQEHRLHGFGGAMSLVVTSLAAAVAEYHRGVVDAYEMALSRQRGEG